MSTAPVKESQPAAKPTLVLSQPAARHGPRMTGWWIGGGVGLVVLIIGGVAVSRWAAEGPPTDDPRSYVVSRISFPVMLKERGELKAKNSVEIRCELPGQSRIVSVVEEGSQVREGDLLLEIDSDELEEEIRQEEIQQANARANYEAAVKELEILLDQNKSDIAAAEVRVSQAEREHEKYIKGDYVKALQDAELEIERAQQVLNRRISDLKDAEGLYERGYITSTDLENDRFEKYEAEVALEKAKLVKQILETYTHPNDLEKKQSELDQSTQELDRKRKSAQAKADKSQAEVEAKKAELDLRTDRVERLHELATKTKIHAPTDGFVVYGSSHRWWDDRQIETGAQVYQGQTLLQLPDPSIMQVSCRIHESKTEQIQIDLPAIVEVEGITGVQFTGTVTKIGALADSRSRWLNPDLKEYTTEVTLDQTHPSMRPGGTATCYITVTQLEDVLAVPVQAVFARGTKRFVFLGNDGSPEPVEVELGLAGTEYVVVNSGLGVGQEVLLAIDEDLLNKLPSSTEAGMENSNYATVRSDQDSSTDDNTEQAETVADAESSAEEPTDAQPAETDEEVTAVDDEQAEPSEVEESSAQKEESSDQPTTRTAGGAEAAAAR